MKKYLLLLFIILMPTILHAKTYVIDNRNIDIRKKDNNTYEVTDEFNIKEIDEGVISLKIPLNLNDKLFSKNIKLNNLYLDKEDKYKFYNNYIKIKFPPKNYNTYKYSYTYELDSSNFSFNLPIINNTVINNLNIKFYINDNTKINDIKINSNKIDIKEKGSTSYLKNNLVINDKDNIKIDIKLDNKINKDKEEIYLYLLIIYIVLVFYLIYKRSKNDNKINKNIKLSSHRAKYLYNKKLNLKEYSSILFSLLNKNYIKIIDDNDDFRFIEAEGKEKLTLEEENFLNIFFRYNDKFRYKDINTDLSYELKNFKRKEKRDLYLINKGSNKRFINLSFILLGVYLLFINLINSFIYFKNIRLAVLSFLLNMFFIINIYISMKDKEISKKLIGFLISVLSIALYILLSKNLYYYNNYLYLSFIFGEIISIISTVILSKISRKEDEIDILKREIISIRNKINSNSKMDNRKEINKNKNYFYDNLSFAYSFNLLPKYLNSFYKKDITNPYWYKGKKDINIVIESIIKELNMINKGI